MCFLMSSSSSCLSGDPLSLYCICLIIMSSTFHFRTPLLNPLPQIEHIFRAILYFLNWLTTIFWFKKQNLSRKGGQWNPRAFDRNFEKRWEDVNSVIHFARAIKWRSLVNSFCFLHSSIPHRESSHHGFFHGPISSPKRVVFPERDYRVRRICQSEKSHPPSYRRKVCHQDYGQKRIGRWFAEGLSRDRGYERVEVGNPLVEILVFPWLPILSVVHI